MVNASLNWASLVGLFLFPVGLIGGGLACVQIYFNLQRRSDTSPAVFAKSILNALQALGRFLVMPFCGFFLVREGWRLDPILQFGVVLVVIGVCYEVIFAIFSDYMRWRFRTGRAAAKISVINQLHD